MEWGARRVGSAMDDPERIARDAAACELENNGTAPSSGQYLPPWDRAAPLRSWHSPPSLLAGVFCEGTFDSWLCWPHTAANSTAYRACPAFVPGFSPEREGIP